MSYIVVKIFDHEEDAARVHDFLKTANLVDLNDAAVVHKDERGKIHIKNETYMGRNVGAVGGGLLSLIIGGLIFPLGGVLIAGALGGLIGKLLSPAIDQKFVKDISSGLGPGTSALFIIVRGETPDKALEGMKDYDGRVHYTSFPDDSESELRNALSGVGHDL